MDITKVHYISTLKHNIKQYDKKTNTPTTQRGGRDEYRSCSIRIYDAITTNANKLNKMKKQFYILTSAEVVDKYESLTAEDFMRSLVKSDIQALIIGDISLSDTDVEGLDWLWILEDEIKEYILTITNNTLWKN